MSKIGHAAREFRKQQEKRFNEAELLIYEYTMLTCLQIKVILFYILHSSTSNRRMALWLVFVYIVIFRQNS